MKIKSCLFSFFLLFQFTTLGSAESEKQLSDKLNSFIFYQYMMDSLPGGYFYPAFFENFAPDATFLIEENNGFSLIDSPRVYFEGDSFINFHWLYDGFSINSVLDEGAPAILLPFSSVSKYQLQGEVPFCKNYGLDFISEDAEKTDSRLMLSNVWPDMGSAIPGATFMVSPHATSEDRSPFLYTERRRIRSNYFADFIFNRKFKHSTLSFSFDYFNMKRQFNDFNSFNARFNEKGRFVLLHAKYKKTYQNGFLNLAAVYNNLSRDRASAELGRLPQETKNKEKQSFFSGVTLKKKNILLKSSFLYEQENLAPLQLNFLKDLKDNDGEGLFPFEKWGSFSSSVFSLSLEVPYDFSVKHRATHIDMFADFQFTSLRAKEGSFENNPVSFDGLPYLVILWEKGRAYRNRNVKARIGTIVHTSLSDRFSLFAKFVCQVSSLRFQASENNLSFVNAGFDAGALLFSGKNPEILISYGQMPYEIRENVNFFLEKQAPWGTICSWNDTNNDLIYQRGEEGQVFGFTGGFFHSVSPELRMPIKKRWLVSVSTPLSQKFRLTVKGIFKKISNNFWVRFKEDYGFYEEIDNVNLYFFSSPFKEFLLSNENFDKDPFYAQLLLHIRGGEEKKWFFSFSFLAHIGMGYTAFGNGPAANDIGILNESQANPNSWINGYGRVDGDRAYVGKMYFGFYLLKNLFLAASFKYRDGTPFAFIQVASFYNQHVFYLQTIQAENWKGVKGGPREDYVSDVSVQLKYQFNLLRWNAELHVSILNLLDFGSELSEYVFSGGSRYASELQIPRSLRIGVLIKM